MREVLTKRHNVLKARLGVGARDKETKSQLDELWIRKTNAVIAQNKNGEEYRLSRYLSTTDYLNGTL